MTRSNEQTEKTRENEIKSKKGLLRSIPTKFKGIFGSFKRGASTETDISIASYELILRTKPEDKDAWMAVALLFHNSFQFEKAIECKLKASDLSPNDPEVKFSLACSYSATGDFSAAIKSFLEALELRPDYAEACEGIADQYLITGEDGKAEEWLQKAHEIKLAKKSASS